MPMMLKSYQRGALLMAALVLVLIIVAMVTAMSFMSVSNIGASGGHMNSTQAFFIANSGLERALFQFSKQDTDCIALTNTNLAVGSGTFSTTGTVYPTAATSSTLSGTGINATVTIIPVTSIANFAPHGRILIESEEIDYSSTSTSAAVCGTQPCFIAEKRGENSTTAAAHASGLAVYQPSQCLIQSTGTAGSAKRVQEAVVRSLSVQTGQATLPDNPNPQSVSVPINPVNPNRSFVVCQNYQDDEHDATRITCELTTPSTLVITNGGTAGSTVNDPEFVQWYVVEFMSGVTVQRGLASFASGSTVPTVNPIVINAVNLANTFVINSERVSQDSQTSDERWTTTAQLSSTINLLLVRNATGKALNVAWQVIQNNNATVQRNAALLTIGQAATSNTGALSPAVDVTKTFLVFTRRAGTATAGIERYYQTRGELTNTTTLTFTRPFQNNTANTQVDIFWYAVSMTDGTTVQRGTAAPAAGGNFVNVTLPTAIVLSRSIPIISVSGDAADIEAASLGATSFIACFATDDACTATSTTNLRLRRENVVTKNANIAWFVIQFAPQVSLLDRREGYP